MSKIIRAHIVAGYVPPQSRESCRHCWHLAAGEENGLGLVPYQKCGEHGFEVRPGGICPDYKPDKRTSPNWDPRQRTLALGA